MMLGWVFTACAQGTCNVKKAYAFYTVSTPGVQMTDDNGNPIPPKATIQRFIYIEWCGVKQPDIEKVLYNNMALEATMTAVEGNTVIPGENTANNSDFKITAKKCNSLWKIELQPSAGNPMPEQGSKNIIIKSREAGKTCEFKIATEQLLMTMPRY